MYPTESPFDQFLPPFGFVGFHRMQKGLNSLVVEQKKQSLNNRVWFPEEANSLFFLSFECIFISDWLFNTDTFKVKQIIKVISINCLKFNALFIEVLFVDMWD